MYDDDETQKNSFLFNTNLIFGINFYVLTVLSHNNRHRYVRRCFNLLNVTLLFIQILLRSYLLFESSFAGLSSLTLTEPIQ